MKIITDEVCSCGHRRSEHQDRDLVEGYGDCQHCDCKVFKFKEWYEEE